MCCNFHKYIPQHSFAMCTPEASLMVDIFIGTQPLHRVHTFFTQLAQRLVAPSLQVQREQLVHFTQK